VLADGHKVTAFSQPTTTAPPATPWRAFVSSATAGEIAVIDNTPRPGLDPDWRLINRIDLCDQNKENARVLPLTPATCNAELDTVPVPFTPNNSNPHGIRFSQLTGMVYSIQEGYRTIVEIDPSTLAVTLVADLSGTNYTAFGISPNGRFLLLRGSTTPVGIRLGVIDLSTPSPRTITDLAIPQLDGASPGAFKFSPDGRRFYILAGTASTVKRDHLFAFDSSSLPALTLLHEIGLISTANGAHSFDVLVQPPTGSPAGTLAEAKYLIVSNGLRNSVSIINATDPNYEIKQTLGVGINPGAVMVYYPGAAAGGHQATSSLTSGSISPVTELPERLDDHGMPE
jgi:DNA-binding beta-propeller fold protein YncE